MPPSWVLCIDMVAVDICSEIETFACFDWSVKHLRFRIDAFAFSKFIGMRWRKTPSCKLTPKINMEPENGPLKKRFSLETHHFQVQHIHFLGVLWTYACLQMGNWVRLHAPSGCLGGKLNTDLYQVPWNAFFETTSLYFQMPRWGIKRLQKTAKTSKVDLRKRCQVLECWIHVEPALLGTITYSIPRWFFFSPAGIR